MTFFLFFRINDSTTLGISDRSFSISLSIQPVSLGGVLVHISRNASGLACCLPLIVFASNRSIVMQILNSNSGIRIFGSLTSAATSTWSYILQAWSSINGLRLHIDSVLAVSFLNLATTYTASTVSNYLTLGNSFHSNMCNQGQMETLAPYQGSIDDVRVYS